MMVRNDMCLGIRYDRKVHAFRSFDMASFDLRAYHIVNKVPHCTRLIFWFEFVVHNLSWRLVAQVRTETDIKFTPSVRENET